MKSFLNRINFPFLLLIGCTLVATGKWLFLDKPFEHDYIQYAMIVVIFDMVRRNKKLDAAG